jgi:translation initiation factor IF-3
VNETIRAPQVYLIGPTGENVGVVPIQKALQIAREADLDLVEVAPDREPPVCRVLDFGKFLYERTKKEREARKAQTKIEVKEIRLRPKTTSAHRDFKVDDARRWLKQGNKVRVTVRFRGREIDYPDIALEDLREVAESLADMATIETPPALEGKNMSMVMVSTKPIKKKPADEHKKEAPAADEKKEKAPAAASKEVKEKVVEKK